MHEPALRSDLRSHRTGAGLSQSELAKRVGVTRQAILAIEAGRQVPSTSLALQLAGALGCSVEDLFAVAPGPSVRALFSGAPEGESGHHSGRVAVGRVDGRWVAHPVPVESAAADGLVVAPEPGGRTDGPAGTSEVTVEPLLDPDRLEEAVLVAGCAPLLGILAGRVGTRYRDYRATWIPAGSGRSLDLLERGLVHVAGLHLVEADTPGGHEALVRARFPGRANTLVSLTRWRQGLVVAPGNPLGIRGIGDLLRPDVRVVNREAGSGAQRLVERLLQDAVPGAAAPMHGPHASGHADVARLVRWGAADAGVAIESAALEGGLDFLPLSEERFDLVVPSSRLDLPHVARLLDLLQRSDFRREVGRLPGYDVSSSGHAATVRMTPGR